jgi:uncharacterized protein
MHVTTAEDRPEVVDVPEQSRFVARVGGAEAELVYAREGDRLLILHTEVPDQLGGHGLGGRLVAAAVSLARADGSTIVPWCPFARRWLHEHSDVADGVAIDWKTPRPPS